MNVDEKLALLLAVEQSGFKITEALKRLDIPRTTYYRWRGKVRREGSVGLKDKKPTPKRQWNLKCGRFSGLLLPKLST